MRVAMAQMLVEGGALESNLQRAFDVIHESAEAEADLVVLPECLDVGWTHPSAHDLATPIPGPVSAQLADVARECGLHIVAGLTERDGDRIYNAAVLIDDRGELLLKHRKISILEIAKDIYARGTKVEVVDTKFAKIGINICADNFPETLHIARTQAMMGAEFIFSPCAWAVPPDHDNEKDPYGDLWRDAYSTLTSEFPIIIIGVSNVGVITGGPWQGHRCIGCSLAIGPNGQAIAQAPYDVECVSIIDFEQNSLSNETRLLKHYH